jgi:hypothetical protein
MQTRGAKQPVPESKKYAGNTQSASYGTGTRKNFGKIKMERDELREDLAKLRVERAERDELREDLAKLRVERVGFQQTAAKYCTERQEMLLEVNMMRESMQLQRMIVDSEHKEIDTERTRLLKQTGMMQTMRASIDTRVRESVEARVSIGTRMRASVEARGWKSMDAPMKGHFLTIDECSD